MQVGSFPVCEAEGGVIHAQGCGRDSERPLTSEGRFNPLTSGFQRERPRGMSELEGLLGLLSV